MFSSNRMYNYCNSYPCDFGRYVTEPASASSSEADDEEWEQQQWTDQQWPQQWNHQQGYYSQWDQNANPYRNTQCPFYATTGQPLVYYATTNNQCSPQCPNNHSPNKAPRTRQARKRSSGGNPNCFVKAFRWYTQDHEPIVPQKKKLADLNVAGFATWLDSKYEEYLHDNQIQQDLKVTQTSVIDKPSVTCTCCPCQQKKGCGINTSTQAVSTNLQAGDTTTSCDENHQSTEFILAPKDFSHPFSECIQTPQSCCSEVPMSKKISIKSRSTASVSSGKDTTVTRVEVIATQQGAPKETKSKPSISNRPSKTINKNGRSKNHVSCQCVIKTDQSNVETQYETSNVTWLETPCSEYCYNSCRITPSVSRKTSGTTTTVKNNGSTNTAVKANAFKCGNNESVAHAPTNPQSKDKSCQCMAEFVAEVNTQFDFECCLYCECPTCFRDGIWTCRNKFNRRTLAPAPPNTQQNSAKSSLCCAQGQPPPSGKCSAICSTTIKVVEPTVQATVATSQQCSKGASIACVNNDVQTSDYAITLGENTFGRCYPLFMKIVCADKLCDDIMCGNV